MGGVAKSAPDRTVAYYYVVFQTLNPLPPNLDRYAQACGQSPWVVRTCLARAGVPWSTLKDIVRAARLRNEYAGMAVKEFMRDLDFRTESGFCMWHRRVFRIGWREHSAKLLARKYWECEVTTSEIRKFRAQRLRDILDKYCAGEKIQYRCTKTGRWRITDNPLEQLDFRKVEEAVAFRVKPETGDQS